MAFYALRAQKKYLMLVSVKFVTSSGAVAVCSTYHNAAGQPLKQKKKKHSKYAVTEFTNPRAIQRFSGGTM